MTDQLKRAIHEAKTAKTTSNPTDKAVASSEEQNFDMSESTYKTTHTAVRKARRFAMQGLYEWLVTDRRFETTDKLGWKDNAPHDIAARTRATNAMHTVHIGYYHEMMRDIPEQIETLDALIEQHLDRKVEQLDTVEHAILLIGAYELQNRLEIPYKVVLDEAMKLNNHFGATDAHKLINAVLDKMAIDLRDLEVQADIKANRRSSQKAAAPAAQPQPQTTDETKAVTNADDTSETPATTGKPRISANKAIKRPRANKAQANISDYRASKKASAQGHNEAAATPTPESTAADVGLHDSNLVNSDEKSKD
ncbi:MULTISPECIES: transcription antitermination factor NusB [Psychrobacter]|uniref:transcription antitermination factor NusB n=1 Tax=Psychrobacter TaxID=497 RepID=UPI000EE3916F|nr:MULTISPECIES: transcription antitermination factor NusB [Psychrobacter]HCH27571.1 transcription antitermination factor NusB [Psychrobacter sp.]